SNSCGGTPITMNPPFATSIPYSFTGLTAAGGPCSITATFTADPTCTGTANFTAPGPCNTTPCNLDFFEANLSACDGTTGGYDITGTIHFSNAPSSGQLIVETCGGQQVTFNAPFVSPLNYTIPGILADGLPCSINCYFTADPACGNSIDFTSPAPCGCGVYTGTYTVNQTGDSNTNNYLCWDDDFAITSNGDFIYPPNVNDATIGYNPGLWWLIFSCPPTIPAGADIENDPCLVGTVSNADLIDINNGAILSSFPAGTFTINTVYFVPITMYDVTGGWYSVTNFAGNCYDLGQTYSYTYLPQLSNGIEVQDCQAQTLSVSFQGGAAELLGSNLTATNLTPANAFFVTDVIANGGSMVIGGLLDGDVVSFIVSDQYGCPIVYTSAPFVGPIIPTITPQNPLCINDPAIQLNASPAGGTWSGTGVTSSGIFDAALAGIGPETISYLPAGCALSDNITIQVTGPTDATITNPGAFCVNDSPFQLVAASPGGTWSGNGVSPSGLFDPAVAGVTTTITYTIPGNCGDTDAQDIVVNPLPNVSFTSDVTSGCTPLVANFTNTSVPVGNGCTWWIEGVPSGNNCGSLITSFDSPGCYDIMLTTQDANGCVNSATINDMVCALAPPEASFTFEPLQPTVNNSTVQFIDLSLGASQYLWTFMNIYNFTAPSPIFTFPNEEAGDYLVCLLVTNAAGCTDTECATVTVQDELVVYIPNTFTPTGDNINEYFKPSIKGESLIFTYEFDIFNRWGDVIFSTKDPSEGWNGSVKGGGYYAQDGIYAWKLRLKTNNGQEPLEWEGHVIILR
ncbi:MAG: T9SS type B sorting domain-containing protein, partial [Bacteroidetes bacterium]|nr:T9SS type B sorting domain-containing protein [Bacteroidota bacterium]